MQIRGKPNKYYCRVYTWCTIRGKPNRVFLCAPGTVSTILWLHNIPSIGKRGMMWRTRQPPTKPILLNRFVNRLFLLGTIWVFRIQSWLDWGGGGKISWTAPLHWVLPHWEVDHAFMLATLPAHGWLRGAQPCIPRLWVQTGLNPTYLPTWVEFHSRLSLLENEA